MSSDVINCFKQLDKVHTQQFLSQCEDGFLASDNEDTSACHRLYESGYANREALSPVNFATSAEQHPAMG